MKITKHNIGVGVICAVIVMAVVGVAESFITLERVWVHADNDAIPASVEVLENISINENFSILQLQSRSDLLEKFPSAPNTFVTVQAHSLQFLHLQDGVAFIAYEPIRRDQVVRSSATVRIQDRRVETLIEQFPGFKSQAFWLVFGILAFIGLMEGTLASACFSEEKEQSSQQAPAVT